MPAYKRVVIDSQRFTDCVDNITAAAAPCNLPQKDDRISETACNFRFGSNPDRTPLTTFRLYTDLLARDMVTDPKDRKEYLQTLRQESDRLTHLIDNVLRYSKLERSSAVPATEIITLADWIVRIAPRLSDRLRQCVLTLDISSRSSGQWKTGPRWNRFYSILPTRAANMPNQPVIQSPPDCAITDGTVVITVSDHGPGVPKTMRAKIFQPFSNLQKAAETAAK